MSSAKRDFEQFVQWLHGQPRGIADDVKRLAHLVLANFDGVARTSNRQSQRAGLLAELCRRDLAGSLTDMPDIAANAAAQDWAWTRLNRLRVGPFRGFRQAEDFDLSRRITLMYGPNGSGKSSFCEALEYALLGSVDEAEATRLGADAYLANVHERRFVAPALSARDARGEVVNLRPNQDAHRFLFVEKNRIDSFSRLASRAPAERSALIATLFGMDQFNDFVGNFNDSMDAKLKLMSVKQRQLATARAGLTQDQQTLEREREAITALNLEDAALAAELPPDLGFDAMQAYIGTEQAPGRLQELSALIDRVQPALVGVSRAVADRRLTEATEKQTELDAREGQLRGKGDEISFQELYTAVSKLRKVDSATCPACDTPLAQVARDPFVKAVDGLAQLRELAELQTARNAARTTRDTASEALRAVVDRLRRFEDEELGDAAPARAPLQIEIASPWWTALQEPADGGATQFEKLCTAADRAELRDAETRTAADERAQRIRERDKLQGLKERAVAQASRRQQLTLLVDTARARVAAFDGQNAALIEEAEAERIEIELDMRIGVAYDAFLRLLRQYRDGLPAQLMAGLNESAMALYNDFNRQDRNEDKLAALFLPTSNAMRIQVAFRGSPERRHDALQVLSEGHIRCLGLAVLMAKATAIGAPLIVFDDAINAIDTEHRQGIRETIFDAQRFADTQLIVTCHSQEFIKDIQNHLLPAHRNDLQVYGIRPHGGDYHPVIHADPQIRSYLVEARAAINGMNDRGALAASRQALEMLSGRVWKWLINHDHGNLSISMRRPGAEPELRNLCEQLLSKARAAGFAHQDKAEVIACLQTLLAANAHVWTYLNKGTHEEEDREDFEPGVVELVVGTLERLDALVLGRAVAPQPVPAAPAAGA
ncbi:AAA family ATPase [Variovorax sp. DAIF25]|uniref:AAA family ATPase n=1 Tax=Variovorax sp. DAIF25 TaxID=3080983 RepID=UPI003D6A1051